jgi:hypothetical protein
LAGGADLCVGDLVIQQGVQLGGFSAGMAQAAAHGLDRYPGVDQLGGMGVAELVDVKVDPSLGAGARLPQYRMRQVWQAAIVNDAKRQTGGVG